MEAPDNTRQSERDMLLLGKNLVTRFFVLIKTAQNYQEGHSAISAPANNLLTVVHQIHRCYAEAALHLKGGHLYLGDLRLKADSSGFEVFRFTMREMAGYFISGITFTPEVTIDVIMKFVQILKRIQPLASFQTYSELQRELHLDGIREIELENMVEGTEYVMDDEVKMDSRSRARRIYFQAVQALDEITGYAQKKKSLRLAKAKRVVQGMIDQIASDPSDLLAFTLLRDNSKYSATHSVNVCILSLLLGRRAGLSKSRCCDLGLAALCHDIGKSRIDQDLLDKPTEFSAEEWLEIQQHPIIGVKLLLELKQFDPLGARMMSSVFEHHMQFDLSGYPRYRYRNPGLFSRIIAIADDYDAFNATRVYLRTAHSPDKVIRFMLSRAGKAYDPVLLKLFITIMGVYPVGTFLLMQSGELAVVVRNRPDRDKFLLPVVRLIATADGEEIDGAVVDTGDHSSGMSIKGAVDTVPFGLDPGGYFM